MLLLSEYKSSLHIFRTGVELYKKDLHDPDNHDGVITHLEPDILEWMWSQVGLRKHKEQS